MRWWGPTFAVMEGWCFWFCEELESVGERPIVREPGKCDAQSVGLGPCLLCSKVQVGSLREGYAAEIYQH